MERNSKNRQAILECLQNTDSHPCAEWIYHKLKPEYPNLSFATVYRNLNQLREAGLIFTVGTVQGQERFDANLNPHSHMICTVCGGIFDTDVSPDENELFRKIKAQTDFSVRSVHLEYRGVCRDCLFAAEQTK